MPTPHELRDLAEYVRGQGVQPRSSGQPLVAAGLWLRLGAAFLDCFLFVLIAFTPVLIVSLVNDFDGHPLDESRGAWACDLVILGVAIVYLASQPVIFRTLGQAWLGLVIVPVDRAAGRRRLVIRYLLHSLPLWLAAVAAALGLLGLRDKTYSTFVPNFANGEIAELLPLAALALMIVLACVPFGEEGDPWYDRVAGTRVLRRTPVFARGFQPIMRLPAEVMPQAEVGNL